MSIVYKSFYLSTLLVLLREVNSYECERDKSRIVREVLERDLLPLFNTAKIKLPPECPFNKKRDRYLYQEETKVRDSGTRWSCGICGKSFIGEIYLDNHMSNRHANTIYTARDSVCLADFCEIFRCEVLSGVAKPNFWDVTLCLEEDMIDLQQDCKETLESCLPEINPWNISKGLKASLERSLCSYLSCKKYWSSPALEEKEPPRSSLVVFTIMLCVGMMIYYCVAINYFFLDTFTEPYDFEEVSNPASLSPEAIRIGGVKHSSKHHRKSMRPAIIQSETNDPDNIFNVGHILDTDLRQAQPYS